MGLSTRVGKIWHVSIVIMLESILNNRKFFSTEYADTSF